MRIKNGLKYLGAQCPACKKDGGKYITWQPDDGLDPDMLKVSCHGCKIDYYLAPLISKKGRSNGNT